MLVSVAGLTDQPLPVGNTDPSLVACLIRASLSLFTACLAPSLRAVHSPSQGAPSGHWTEISAFFSHTDLITHIPDRFSPLLLFTPTHNSFYLWLCCIFSAFSVRMCVLWGQEFGSVFFSVLILEPSSRYTVHTQGIFVECLHDYLIFILCPEPILRRPVL